MLPPLPPWEGMHPIIVHYPIALLSIVPLFILLALWPKAGKPFSWAALLLMAIGSAGAIAATSSGEAAEGLVPSDRVIRDVLHEHEEAGESARNAFIALTLVYAAFLIIPLFVKKAMPAAAVFGFQLLFLFIYVGCLLLLIEAGHLGGKLVHEHGVRALFNANPAVPRELRERD